MGDVGDYWNDHRDYRREQKIKQQPFVDALIRKLYELADVRELSGDGPHLRVNGALDFWPSTRTTVELQGADTALVQSARQAIKKARKHAFAATGQNNRERAQ